MLPRPLPRWSKSHPSLPLPLHTKLDGAQLYELQPRLTQNDGITSEDG